jgi:putative protease
LNGNNCQNRFVILQVGGYTDGFYRRHQPEELQTYFDNYSRSNKQQIVGEILEYKDGKILIETKNKFSVGDSIEVILPDRCFNDIVKSMTTENNEKIEVAKGSGYRVWIPIKIIDPSFGFIAKNFDEAIKIKNKNIKKDPSQKIRRPSW